MKRILLIALIGLFVASCCKDEPSTPTIHPATAEQLAQQIDMPVFPDLKPGRIVTWSTPYDELLDALDVDAEMIEEFEQGINRYVWIWEADYSIGFYYKIGASSISYIATNPEVLPERPYKTVGMRDIYLFSNTFARCYWDDWYPRYYPLTQNWIDFFHLN